MVSGKVKAIREMLGITETQVSKTINVNSYKYKRGESDPSYLTTEMIILLSVVYKIPFDRFLRLDCSVDSLIKSDYLNILKKSDNEEIINELKDNLCSYFSKKRRKANSITIDLILKKERKAFASRIKSIRESQFKEISLLCQALEITETVYKNFESGSTFPSLEQIVRISECLSVPINALISL